METSGRVVLLTILCLSAVRIGQADVANWQRLGSASIPTSQIILADGENHLVQVGGASPEGANSAVFRLALAPGSTWEEIELAGAQPGPRLGPGVAYDPMGRRLIRVGGYPEAWRCGTRDTWIADLDFPGRWNQAPDLPAAGRADPAAVIDTRRNRLILFGGRNQCVDYGYYDEVFNDCWQLDLETTLWTPIQPPSGPGPSMSIYSAAYDSLVDRLLVVGREFPEGPFALWELRFDPAPLWNRVLNIDAWPVVGAEFSTLLDAPNNRLLAFSYGLGILAVLEFDDSPSWEVHTLRTSHMVYDSHPVALDRDRNWLVFSRWALPDIWALSLAGDSTWYRLAPRGSLAVQPQGRQGAVLIDAPALGHQVMTGGEHRVFSNCCVHCRNYYYETFAEAWTIRQATTPPWSVGGSVGFGQRAGSVAVRIPEQSRTVVVGGTRDGGGECSGPNEVTRTAFRDAWQWADGDPVEAWTRIPIVNEPDGPAGLVAGDWDGRRGRIIVFANNADGNRVSALELGATNRWVSMNRPGIDGFADYSSGAFDPRRDRLIAYGLSRPDVTWIMPAEDGRPWEMLPTAGPTPPFVNGMRAVVDPLRDRYVLLVPNNGTLEVWVLDLAAMPPRWQMQQPVRSAPSSRTGEAVLYRPLEDELIVFGGSERSDLWILRGDSPTPVLSSLVSANWDGVRVRAEWNSALVSGAAVGLERAIDDEPWERIGTGFVTGDQRVIVEDRSPRPGHRHAYAFSWTEDGQSVRSAPAFVVVPESGTRISLRRPTPNPTRGEFNVEVVGVSPAAARLMMVDLSGRRVWSSPLSAPSLDGVSRQRVNVAELSAGLYFLTLDGVPGSERRRVVVIR